MVMRYPDKINGLAKEFGQIALDACLDLRVGVDGKSCNYHGLKDLIDTLDMNLLSQGQRESLDLGPLHPEEIVTFARLFGFLDDQDRVIGEKRKVDDVYDALRSAYHALRGIYDDLEKKRRIPFGEIEQWRNFCLRASRISWQDEPNFYRLVG